MTRPEPRKSFWSTVPGIVTTVAGLITAIGGAIAALAAAGVLGPSPGPGPGPGPTPVPGPVVTAEPQPSLAAIDLVYTGDNYGCQVQIVIDVGGQTAQPFGSRYRIDEVPVGVQHYEIRGSISCAKVGNCAAAGSGTVSVADGRTYYLRWLNTAVGQCDVTLAS